MLLQFSVENFLSFREPQVLSMLAAEDVDHPPHMVMEGPDGKKVLRCAAVYGANASGKSNLVKALEFGVSRVLEGRRPDEKWYLETFKLDRSCSGRPSKFEWEFETTLGIRYSYGFEITRERVETEWLFATVGADEHRIFTRTGEQIDFAEGMGLSVERVSFIRFVAQGTRPNQLFLSEARERNVRELTPVFDAFKACRVVFPNQPFVSLFSLLREQPDFKSHLVQLLSSFGTGVENVELEDVGRQVAPSEADEAKSKADVVFDAARNSLSVPVDKIMKDASSFIHGVVRVLGSGAYDFVSRGGQSVQALVSYHRGVDGEPTKFEFTEESDGTQRLFQLAPVLFAQGSDTEAPIFAIDELERSLHPLLTRELLRRFLTESNTTQLLFTTHDTNLLDLTLLSRDAIWFTEKDAAGATVLYSLAEYKSDQIAALGPQLEKGYLQGRFGAIPFLGDPTRLGWKKAAE